MEMSRKSIFVLAVAAVLGSSAVVPASAGTASAFPGRLGNPTKFSSAALTARSQSAFGPGGRVMINPQPLPPRYQSTFRPGGWVMLNPQPLPPRVGGAGMFR
jgi:hypothetical protein